MNKIAEQILDYITFLEAKHRDSYAKLKTEGKSYRSRAVTLEIGYINALIDMKDAIEQPEKNRQLSEVMGLFSKKMKW